MHFRSTQTAYYHHLLMNVFLEGGAFWQKPWPTMTFFFLILFPGRSWTPVRIFYYQYITWVVWQPFFTVWFVLAWQNNDILCPAMNFIFIRESIHMDFQSIHYVLPWYVSWCYIFIWVVILQTSQAYSFIAHCTICVERSAYTWNTLIQLAAFLFHLLLSNLCLPYQIWNNLHHQITNHLLLVLQYVQITYHVKRTLALCIIYF